MAVPQLKGSEEFNALADRCIDLSYDLSIYSETDEFTVKRKQYQLEQDIIELLESSELYGHTALMYFYGSIKNQKKLVQSYDYAKYLVDYENLTALKANFISALNLGNFNDLMLCKLKEFIEENPGFTPFHVDLYKLSVTLGLYELAINTWDKLCAMKVDVNILEDAPSPEVVEKALYFCTESEIKNENLYLYQKTIDEFLGAKRLRYISSMNCSSDGESSWLTFIFKILSPLSADQIFELNDELIDVLVEDEKLFDVSKLLVSRFI